MAVITFGTPTITTRSSRKGTIVNITGTVDTTAAGTLTSGTTNLGEVLPAGLTHGIGAMVTVATATTGTYTLKLRATLTPASYVYTLGSGAATGYLATDIATTPTSVTYFNPFNFVTNPAAATFAQINPVWPNRTLNMEVTTNASNTVVGKLYYELTFLGLAE